MSVQITKKPAQICFSRNPVVFELKTDARLQVAGTPFIAKLVVADLTPDTYSFTLSYADISIQFTASPYPDNSGYQFRSRWAGASDQEYADSLAADLSSNFYLNRDFAFVVTPGSTGPYVRMTARKNGDQYNPYITPAVNFDYIPLQGGSRDVPNPNFKLYYELWVQTNSSGPAQKASDAYLEVTDDGLASIDISDQLTDAMIAGGYDRPDFENAIARVNTTSTCRFYIKYAEVFGETQVIRRVHQTDTFNALLGGISNEMQATFKLPDSFMANGKLRFLKQDLAEKYLLPEQAEFLSIVMSDADHNGVGLKFTLYFDDDTTVSFYKFSIGNVSRYDKLTFPVGFVQNNLNLVNESRAVIKYSVVLTDSGNNELSETRTYWLDYEYRPDTRQFIYLSSMGTYDTLVTFGKGSTQYELVKNTAETATDKGFVLADGDQINYSNSLNNTETVTSGYREKAEIRLFKDMALSVDLLLYRKKRVYAVAFSSKTVKEFKDGENLHAISFDIGFRYNEQLFTVDDRDDQDVPLFMPMRFSAGVVAPAVPDNSLDYRYYRKTETYNQQEINDLIAQLNALVGILQGTEADHYKELVLALTQKAEAVHNHDDRYIPREEMTGLLIELQKLLDEGLAGFIELVATTDTSYSSTIWKDKQITPFNASEYHPDFPYVSSPGNPNTFGAYWMGTTIVDRAKGTGRMEAVQWDVSTGKIINKIERVKDDDQQFTNWGAWTFIATQDYVDQKILSSNKYCGKYITIAALQAITGFEGAYAYLDAGPGTDAVEYIWDATDSKWTPSSNSGASSFGQLAGLPGDNTALAAALNDKVYKIAGKGLSTNDYTTDEKNKLGAIVAGANLMFGYPKNTSGKVFYKNETKIKAITLDGASSFSYNLSGSTSFTTPTLPLPAGTYITIPAGSWVKFRVVYMPNVTDATVYLEYL